jgi:hypothetical protein
MTDQISAIQLQDDNDLNQEVNRPFKRWKKVSLAIWCLLEFVILKKVLKYVGTTSPSKGRVRQTRSESSQRSIQFGATEEQPRTRSVGWHQVRSFQFFLNSKKVSLISPKTQIWCDWTKRFPEKLNQLRLSYI